MSNPRGHHSLSPSHFSHNTSATTAAAAAAARMAKGRNTEGSRYTKYTQQHAPGTQPFSRHASSHAPSHPRSHSPSHLSLHMGAAAPASARVDAWRSMRGTSRSHPHSSQIAPSTRSRSPMHSIAPSALTATNPLFERIEEGVPAAGPAPLTAKSSYNSRAQGGTSGQTRSASPFSTPQHSRLWQQELPTDEQYSSRGQSSPRRSPLKQSVSTTQDQGRSAGVPAKDKYSSSSAATNGLFASWLEQAAALGNSTASEAEFGAESPAEDVEWGGRGAYDTAGVKRPRA